MPQIKNIALFGQVYPFNFGLVRSYGYFDSPLPASDTIPNHVERALDLLVEQFEDSTELHKLITALLSPIQEVEYVMSDLITLTTLETATADQLDIIGEIVGESRNNRTDTDYRVAIKLRIFLNKSAGEPEVLIMLCRFLTRATKIHYTETYPAKCTLVFKTIYPPPSNLRESLELVAPTGVKLFLDQSDNDPDFGFDGEGSYPPESDVLGFGEEGMPEEGGKFVEII